MVTDARGNELESDAVFVVRQGILNMWVCAPKTMNRAQVQREVDATVFPSGTSHGWQVVEEQHKEAGLCSPGYCQEASATRQHWNVKC